MMRLIIYWTFTALAVAHQISYRNYKVYHVIPSTDQHRQLIKSLEDEPNVDFWTDLHEHFSAIKIMVSPTFQDEFEYMLNRSECGYKIAVNDVEELLNEERVAQGKAAVKVKGGVSFDKYYRYGEIQNYLHRLAAELPEVSLERYGSSYENRNLTLIRISSGDEGKKPIIFVDGGIHAREWIAPAQVLYIINQLLENPENRYMFRNIDWIIIPVLNPDGYEYTHTTDRLWRKTRSKGKECDGVDPNRNFDFHWMGPGASAKECSNTYAGPSPFSEPETLALSKTIQRFSDHIKLYLSFHSPAQSYLYPWGYTDAPPDNLVELRELAEESAQAVYAVNHTRYKIGSSFNTLSPAAGSSRDWAYGAAKIRLSYTMELPAGRDSRFEIPPEEILSIVKPMFEGVRAFHQKIEQKYCKDNQV